MAAGTPVRFATTAYKINTADLSYSDPITAFRVSLTPGSYQNNSRCCRMYVLRSQSIVIAEHLVHWEVTPPRHWTCSMALLTVKNMIQYLNILHVFWNNSAWQGSIIILVAADSLSARYTETVCGLDMWQSLCGAEHLMEYLVP